MPTVENMVPRWASTCSLDIRSAPPLVRQLVDKSKVNATRYAQRYVNGGKDIQIAAWNKYRTVIDTFPALPTVQISR